MDGIKELMQKRESYRIELARRLRGQAQNGDFMIEVYQKLLGDVERQLNASRLNSAANP